MLNQYHIDYRKKNRTKILAYYREYSKRNKLSINARKRKYFKLRCSMDPSFKIAHTMRSRLYAIVHYKRGKLHTKALVGCSFKELKQYLEDQFKPGMSWANYGTGFNGKGMQQWHIDHIRPCASFDLSNVMEQQKCFHYTNLQPLWARENIIKNAT